MPEGSSSTDLRRPARLDPGQSPETRARQGHVTRLSIIVRIGRALSANLALAPLLETVYREVSRLFDTTNFYIALNPPGTDQLLFSLNYDRGQARPAEVERLGRSLASHILRTGKPLMLTTAAETQALLECERLELGGEPSRSWMGVPLRSRESVFGVMVIQDHQREGAYSQEDLELFSAIASHLGIALRNAQLFEDAERRARETKIITAIGRDILSTFDLETVLDRIVASVRALLTQDCVAIFFDAKDIGSYQAVAACGPIERQLRALTLDRGKGILGTIAMTGIPEIIENTDLDPRVLFIPGTSMKNPRQKLMGVPMFARGKIIGLIAVWRGTSEPPFQARDLAFLDKIGRQASIAIGNAQLFGRAEAALAEAESASRAKSAFLASMSHELRTPLNAILLYSELLMEEMKEREFLDLARDIEKVQGAGKQLLGLIDDILDLSKIEAGRMTPFLEACDLALILGEVAEVMTPVAARNGNRLQLRLQPGLAALRSDHRMVRQLFCNLLGIVIRFTRDGIIHLDIAQDPEDPGRIRGCLSGTGDDLKADQRKAVFQALLQREEPLSGHIEGTGLSLALSRKFKELLGGDLRVEHLSGRGTVLVVGIPGLGYVEARRG